MNICINGQKYIVKLLSMNNSTLIDDNSVRKVYYQVTPALQNSIKAPSSGRKDLRSFLMHIFAIFFFETQNSNFGHLGSVFFTF